MKLFNHPVIIRDRHKITEDIGNILVIQLGDIGDVVWVTPTLWAIKASYPQAKVSVALREDRGTLLKADPSLHRIFAVKRKGKSFFKRAVEQIWFVRTLQRERFDLVFDLRADDRGAIMAYLTGAPIRIAQYYCGLPFWRNRLFTHLVLPPPARERVRGAAEQSLRIVRGCGIDAKTTIPRLWVAEQVSKKVQQILNSEKIGTVKWVTLNPFSRWRYKEWGYDRWVQIINWLWDEFHVATIVVGAEAERVRAAELVKTCRGTVYNLAGKTTLIELAGLLQLSRLHLGVDSAAPHIAAAVGTPTITIYGPSDWWEWAPLGDHHRVVVPDMDCVPCRQKGCHGTEQSRCLETLEIAKVQESIREAIVRVFPASSPILPPPQSEF